MDKKQTQLQEVSSWLHAIAHYNGIAKGKRPGL